MSRKSVGLTQDQIQQALDATSTAVAAADMLGVKYSTFARYAKRFGVHRTNQGNKGVKRDTVSKRQIPLQEILKRNTSYKTATLKARLIDAGLKNNECEECGLPNSWQGKALVMHLDHVDGDNTNNEICNLRILCPNCHSQTSTYCRGFRIKK